MPKQEIYDEHRVLQLLAEGSEYAFTQIFDHYRGNVYTTSLKFLKSPVLAEETVQDVFLKIWLKRQMMSGIQNFESYLFVITRNLIFDRIKKIAHDARLEKELAKSNPIINDTDHRVQSNHYQQILNKALDLLPPQQKQVYILSKVEGLSRDEIARQMQISPLTVKKHLSLALESIRKHLKQYPDLFMSLLLYAMNS